MEARWKSSPSASRRLPSIDMPEARASRKPGGVGDAAGQGIPLLLPAGHRPQQVRQAVEVGHDRASAGQPPSAWRSARHQGAGQVEGRRSRSSPGSTNSVIGGNRSSAVDQALELVDHGAGDRGLAGRNLARLAGAVASSAMRT